MGFKKVFLCLFASLTFVLPVFGDEAEPPLPRAMAVFGDSISEGLMTEFSIERAPTFGQIFEMFMLALEQSDMLKRILVFRKRYAKMEHSWSTGGDERDIVYSHFERLKQFVPDLKAYNFAVSGSKASALHKQVEQFLETEEKENIRIDYITVMVGANDIKAATIEGMTSPDIYGANIEVALRKILDKDPHRSVMLVGLPKILDIFERSSDLTAYEILGIDYKCSTIRRKIYGDVIFFDPTNQEPYERSRILISDYERALSDIVQRLKGLYPEAFFKVVTNYDSPEIPFKSLSIDCFHPSIWGQALLAELTWNAGFWPLLISDEEILWEQTQLN